MRRNAYCEYQKHHSLLAELRHKCKHVAVITFPRSDTASVCNSGRVLPGHFSAGKSLRHELFALKSTYFYICVGLLCI